MKNAIIVLSALIFLAIMAILYFSVPAGFFIPLLTNPWKAACAVLAILLVIVTTALALFVGSIADAMRSR